MGRVDKACLGQRGHRAQRRPIREGPDRRVAERHRMRLDPGGPGRPRGVWCCLETQGKALSSARRSSPSWEGLTPASRLP